MENAQKKNRLEWVDTAKGIGILLVVLGHGFRDEMMADSLLCAFFYHLIYGFHMPLYFAISGFTFGLSYRKYLSSPGQMTVRRLRALLVPVVSYACAIYLCFWAAYQIPFLRDMLSATSYVLYPFVEYMGIMFLHENPYSAHLWYMWVLLVLSLIAFFILYLGKDRRSARISFYAVALVCFCVTLFTNFPAAIRKLMQHMIWFALGMELSDRQELLETPKTGWTVLGWAGLVLNAVLLAGNLLPDTDLVEILRRLLLMLAVFPAIHSLLCLSVRLGARKPLHRLGQESYAVYLLHQPLCCGFVGILLYNKLGAPIPAVFLVCTALSFLLPMAAVYLCRKVRPIGRLARLLLNIS